MQNNSARKKVAIYARVSTTEQAEQGYSIDAQLRVLNDYCTANNKLMYKEYVDRGISGKSIEGRLQLQQLLIAAQNHEFDEVIVWKINRISRKQIDLLKIVEILNRNNIIFRSYSENFETETPIGKFALQMMGSVAELERNTIVENVKLGMKQRAREGNWNGGVVLGYTSKKTDKPSDKNKSTALEIVADEALLVKKIFNLYASGKGLKAIANELNHQGYHTKRKNPFSITSIKDIILNPIYIGKIRFGKSSDAENYLIVDGNHERIISDELWTKVQELYKSKARRPPKTFVGSFPLTGIIRCPVCGYGMVAHRGKVKNKDGTYTIHRYYACGAWRNKGTAVCHSNSISADYVEEYVFNRIRNVLTTPKALKNIVDTINQKNSQVNKPLSDELNLLNNKLADFDTKIGKYLTLYADNILTKEQLKAQINLLDMDKDTIIQRKSDIETQLATSSTAPIPYDLVKSTLENFQATIHNLPPEKQKLLLQLIIQEITITTSKKVKDITLKFDEHSLKTLEESSITEGSSVTSSPIVFSYPILLARFTLPI